MKNINIRNIIIVFVLSIISMVLGLNNVYADSTVLYSDGTLIINEKNEDRDSNIEKHGQIEKEYLPLSEKEDYKFSHYNSVLWHNETSKIINVELGQTLSPISTSYWFYDCRNLITADLTKLDTSKVTDMSYMFAHVGGARNWNILGLSNWDTSNVTDMSYMFYGASYNFDSAHIGILKIPSNCKVDYFAIHARRLNASFELQESVSNFEKLGYNEYMFYKTSTLVLTKTNLYYSDKDSKELVERIVNLYGVTDSDSKSNVYIGRHDIKLTNCKILSDTGSEVKNAAFLDKIQLSIKIPEFYNLKSIKIYNENGDDVTTLVDLDLNNYTFVMPNFSIKVETSFVLQPNVYELSWSYSEGGKYSSTLVKEYKDNIVKINAVPDRGYKIKEVIITNEDKQIVNEDINYDNISNTFIMPDYNVNVFTDYEAIKYKVLSEYTKGGNVSVVREATYNSENVFTVNVDSGYILKSLKVIDISNNKDVSSLVNLNKKHWTFTMPDYDVKVKAVFTKRPSAPKTVTAKLYGHDDVIFSWNKVTGADGYLVYYKKSTSKSYTLLLATTATSIKKANLTDGVKYYFKVVPYVKDINGIKRYNTFKVSSIYTLKQLNTPIVSKYSKNYVKIKWNNINGESGYQIARKKYGTSTYYIVKTVSYKYSSTTLKTTRGKTYYYKVRAYKTVDGKKIYGPWSYVKSYKLK